MCKTIKPITGKEGERGEEGSREKGRGLKKRGERKGRERLAGHKKKKKQGEFRPN